MRRAIGALGLTVLAAGFTAAAACCTASRKLRVSSLFALLGFLAAASAGAVGPAMLKLTAIAPASMIGTVAFIPRMVRMRSVSERVSPVAGVGARPANTERARSVGVSATGSSSSYMSPPFPAPAGTFTGTFRFTLSQKETSVNHRG